MLTQDEKIALLVADLRANAHLQGTNYLCRNDKYCCLGRACEVAIANGLDVKKRSESNGKAMVTKYDDFAGSMPDSVRDWYGFSYNEGLFFPNEEGPEYTELTSCNDFYRLTFPEIASLIEARPEGMFVSTNTVK